MASSLAALAPACGGAGGPPVCYGGARYVGNDCYCPLGTTWNGSTCQGVPQAGVCTAGQMQVQNMCFCPDAYTWTGAACEALQCSGGSVVAQNECVCPDGRSWIDGACQIQCIPNAVRTDPNTCVCPQGTEPQGDVFGCQPVAVAAEQPMPPTSGGAIEQNTTIRQSTQSLTCCINGASYTCPSQDAFQRCMGLDPSLCARSGSC